MPRSDPGPSTDLPSNLCSNLRCFAMFIECFRAASVSWALNFNGGNFNLVHSASLGEWEIPTDHAVNGARTLTITVSQN